MFREFIESEKSAAVLLLACTLLSLALANSPAGAGYVAFWQTPLAGLSVVAWINDALMAIFFLHIGLELERELYVGELADFRQALLPVLAALGGMVAPAAVHLFFNAGSATQAGVGIPTATDIAFALGVLAVLGTRVPAALKVFVVAFAVMDDLGAIVIIALFYTRDISPGFLAGAAATWVGLVLMNHVFRVRTLLPYLAGGVVLWALTLKSGVHATIAGVLLAFAIPFERADGADASPSQRLEHALHRPVAFVILPLFALANTALVLGSGSLPQLASANSLGIIGGLLLGKPLGIVLACALAVAGGACRLPAGVGWRHIAGAGMLGGIGFTMSIFIADLAFAGRPADIETSKLAILAASAAAGLAGFAWLRAMPPATVSPDEG